MDAVRHGLRRGFPTRAQLDWAAMRTVRNTCLHSAQRLINIPDSCRSCRFAILRWQRAAAARRLAAARQRNMYQNILPTDECSKLICWGDLICWQTRGDALLLILQGEKFSKRKASRGSALKSVRQWQMIMRIMCRRLQDRTVCTLQLKITEQISISKKCGICIKTLNTKERRDGVKSLNVWNYIILQSPLWGFALRASAFSIS